MDNQTIQIPTRVVVENPLKKVKQCAVVAKALKLQKQRIQELAIEI